MEEIIKINLFCKVKNSSNFTYKKSYPTTIILRDYHSLATVIINDTQHYDCSLGMLYHLFYTEQEWRNKQINKVLTK